LTGSFGGVPPHLFAAAALVRGFRGRLAPGPSGEQCGGVELPKIKRKMVIGQVALNFVSR
jgi:hypothetical protein